MAVTPWLIDKSAYVRLGDSPDLELWTNRIGRGLVRIAGITRLEIGYSMRSAEQSRSEFGSAPLSLMPVEHLTPGMEQRALQVQQMLAERGRHRGPSIPDLLIAATAELSGHSVLAVDKHFDLIAEVTGQAVERLTT